MTELFRYVETSVATPAEGATEEEIIYAREKSAAKMERMGYNVGFRLCERLSQNRTLRSLNLKSNAFSSLHGLDLSTNDTLCHLSHTCRGPEAKQIAFICNLNAAGRRLVRLADPIPLGIWPIVLARCSSNADALHYFVQNISSLWMKQHGN